MTFQIKQRPIGDGHPVYLIAEISANHNHDYDKTVRLIDAAHAAGADAVKLQTYTADTLTIDCDKPHFKIQQGTIWDGQTLHQLYADAAMPWDWQPKLKQHADSIGIDLFSSPFDQTAVDFLQSLDVPAYKIASFEIVDTLGYSERRTPENWFFVNKVEVLVRLKPDVTRALAGNTKLGRHGTSGGRLADEGRRAIYHLSLSSKKAWLGQSCADRAARQTFDQY